MSVTVPVEISCKRLLWQLHYFFYDTLCVVYSLRCDVVMTHSPLEIAIASMYFSLKYHNISHLMPGGMQWYSKWSVTEDRIKGKHPSGCQRKCRFRYVKCSMTLHTGLDMANILLTSHCLTLGKIELSTE